MISFTLQQSTAILGGPKYQVTNLVTTATDASTAVYVYKTADKCFSHYAAAADMEQWPDTYEKAFLAGTKFYRTPCVTRVWDSVRRMNEDLLMSSQRLQFLADELTAQQGELIINRTTIIVGS